MQVHDVICLFHPAKHTYRDTNPDPLLASNVNQHSPCGAVLWPALLCYLRFLLRWMSPVQTDQYTTLLLATCIYFGHRLPLLETRKPVSPRML